MIEVKTCGNSAKWMYKQFGNNVSLINLLVDQFGMKFEVELTVAEAQQLAEELMDLVNEIKDEQVEEVSA